MISGVETGNAVRCSRGWAAQRADAKPLVDPAIVLDDDHLPADMAEELSEEHAHSRSREVVVVQLKGETETLPPGTDREGGDGGNPIVPLPRAQGGSGRGAPRCDAR